MNYYQFHISDWALHTSHLTLEEEGVYRRLLDFYYDTEKPIPTETQPVIRRLRLGSHSETVALILSEFFHLEEDGWHNYRADIEIAEYQSRAVTARENGKKGGRPKKNSGVKTQSVIFANPDETGSKANQEPLTKNQEPITNNENKDISPQAADSDPVIEIFSHWKTIMNHPRAKLDEKRRKKIREALKLGYTQADLIAAIDGCAKSPYHMGQDGKNFTVYDDLELILRDAKHIDQFLKFYTMPHPQVGGLHATTQQPHSHGGGAGNRPFAEIVGQQARDVIRRIGDRANGNPGGGTVRENGGPVSQQG